MRILIIDDDPAHRWMYRYAMESEGYEVLEAVDGSQGITLARDDNIDMVLLDVILPDSDGYEVCRQVRAISDVPILIMSSAMTMSGDVARGLNLGADLYLHKSQEISVIRATVRALLRRSKLNLARRVQQLGSYVDPHLVLDFEDEHVIVEGKRVHLSPLEFRLLAILASHRSQVISTSDICEVIWPDLDPEQARKHLHTYISRLRHHIEPEPADPCYILTDHGLGYTFMPQLS